MAGADNVVYAQNLPLLTIKGRVSIFFLDGKMIEGEFISQDRHNIFVEIDGAPLMIPRLQIRYIKGKEQQEVEPDTSPLELAGAPAITETQPLPTPSLPKIEEPEAEKAGTSTEPGLSRRSRDTTLAGIGVASGPPDHEPPAPAEEAVEDEEDDRTFVLPPADSDQFYEDEVEDEDEDDHTYILPPEPEPAVGVAAEEEEYDDEDDDDRTFVLPPQPEPEPAAYTEEDEEDSTVVIAPGEFDDEDPDDVTMVLGEMEEEDDLTINLSQPPQEPTAKLICTGGPHSGEVLELQSGITTLGRASDNVLVLPQDKELSRHHAIIVQESGRFMVQDQNSLNGTYVNDELISGPRYLEDGDAILIGLSTFKFEQE